MKEGFGIWSKDKREGWGGINGMGSGIIAGPDSGFPVHMHPSLPPSFIGHGVEYIATKGDGKGYVIPLDNFATRRNQHNFKSNTKSTEYDSISESWC